MNLMWKKNKEFFLALSVLVGTIVGVGIFGIPYAVAQSGFIVGVFYLLILGVALIFVHLFFGEIILRTRGKHLLIGYANKYLGEWGRGLATFALVFGLYGSLLAYIIVAGEFLYTIFGGYFGGSPYIFSILFFIVGAIFIYRGLKLISEGELVMTLFLILTVGIIAIKAWPEARLINLTGVNWIKSFLPYGVILFALSGFTAIPELPNLLKNKAKLKPIIIWGTIIPIIIYLIFTLVIVGVTGGATSPEAIAGLSLALGDGVALVGAIFGFLAVATSFFVVGLNLKDSLWLDYKINHNLSWALSVFIPFIIFVLGLRGFVEVISVVGAVMGGMVGVLVILMFYQAKKMGDREPEFSLRPWKYLSVFLSIIFVLGILYEVWGIFR